MKKITRATLKSFIRKNKENLYIKNISDFDGMQDMVDFNKDAEYQKAKINNENMQYTLGIKQIWLVGSSRDYFSKIDNENYEGIHVYNCCGSFDVVIKKEKKEEKREIVNYSNVIFIDFKNKKIA